MYTCEKTIRWQFKMEGNLGNMGSQREKCQFLLVALRTTGFQKCSLIPLIFNENWFVWKTAQKIGFVLHAVKYNI